MMNADVHSGEDVILTATGPGSDRVRGQMDNTEVFRVMVEALGLGAATGTDHRCAGGARVSIRPLTVDGSKRQGSNAARTRQI